MWRRGIFTSKKIEDWNFSNKDQSSVKGMVWKEKLLIYLSKLTVNVYTQELGADSTKVIAANGAHSKIACPNMSVSPHPK